MAHPEIHGMKKSTFLTMAAEAGALIIQAHPFRDAEYMDHMRLYPRHVHGLEEQMPPEEIADAIGNSDVYITLWGSPRLDESILKKAPSLKLLTHLAGTVVPFVSDELWERGIRVISGNDYFAESVAEGTLAQ